MIRHTGGFAVGATSTRSRSCCPGELERLPGRADAQLLSLLIDEADLLDADAVVDPEVWGRWCDRALLVLRATLVGGPLWRSRACRIGTRRT